MAKIYQSKESKQWIPHNAYMAIIYLIRDYDRQKMEYSEYLTNIHRGKKPTEETVLRLEKMGHNVKIIDRALQSIPEEYREGIWNNIVYADPYPDYAIRTWSRHKWRFVQSVGVGLGWID